MRRAIALAWLWLGVAALAGWRTMKRPAMVALVMAIAALALMAWDLTGYLDRTHYLLLATCIFLLVSEQVIALRRARLERDEQARLAAALAERLRKAEEKGEPILALRDGSPMVSVGPRALLSVICRSYQRGKRRSSSRRTSSRLSTPAV